MVFYHPQHNHTPIEGLMGAAELLACGDDVGTLQVLELPRTLSRGGSEEEAAMILFINRPINSRPSEQNLDQQVNVLPFI